MSSAQYIFALVASTAFDFEHGVLIPGTLDFHINSAVQKTMEMVLPGNTYSGSSDGAEGVRLFVSLFLLIAVFICTVLPARSYMMNDDTPDICSEQGS